MIGRSSQLTSLECVSCLADHDICSSSVPCIDDGCHGFRAGKQLLICIKSMVPKLSLITYHHRRTRRGAAAPPGLKNFRANSVFRATASSSKLLINKIYFSTVKNSRATLFSRASAGYSKLQNNKKYIQYSENFQGKRNLLKNPECKKYIP